MALADFIGSNRFESMNNLGKEVESWKGRHKWRMSVYKPKHQEEGCLKKKSGLYTKGQSKAQQYCISFLNV